MTALGGVIWDNDNLGRIGAIPSALIIWLDHTIPHIHISHAQRNESWIRHKHIINSYRRERASIYSYLEESSVIHANVLTAWTLYRGISPPSRWFESWSFESKKLIKHCFVIISIHSISLNSFILPA